VGHADLDNINGGISRRFKIQPSDYESKLISDDKIDELQFFQRVNETITQS